MPQERIAGRYSRFKRGKGLWAEESLQLLPVGGLAGAEVFDPVHTSHDTLKAGRFPKCFRRFSFQLLVILVIVGQIPMDDATIARIIRVVFIVIVAVYLIYLLLGLLGPAGGVPLIRR